MNSGRQQLLDWIDRDRDDLVRFLQAFVQHRSPNPPGDTRDAAEFITSFLEQRGLPYRIISPHPEMPNIVGSFDCARPGTPSRPQWPYRCVSRCRRRRAAGHATHGAARSSMARSTAAAWPT